VLGPSILFWGPHVEVVVHERLQLPANLRRKHCIRFVCSVREQGHPVDIWLGGRARAPVVSAARGFVSGVFVLRDDDAHRTVRTGECENTFDRHMDKIWAIATLDKHRWIENAVDEGDAASSAAEGGDEARAVDYSSMFASGGSDSRVLFWRDVTAEEEDKKTRLREETLLLEQQLTNHMRNRNFTKVSYPLPASSTAFLMVHEHRHSPWHWISGITANY
jgi:hypothetical protein